MGWTTRTLRCYWRQLTVALTPILLLPLPIALGKYMEVRCGYVILVMAVFWVTEALPLFITGLIPVFAFPLLGILSTKEVCISYMEDPVMLFLGALMLGTAIENSGLDKRLALFILLRTGKNPRLLMGGFMITTMLLSMCMNNAAAAAMMIPTLDAILQEMEEKWETHTTLIIPKITITDMEENKEMLWGELNQGFQDDFETEMKSSPPSSSSSKSSEGKKQPRELIQKSNSLDIDAYRRCVYLSIAYAANIGGTGLITGTPPNIYLMGLLSKSFSEPTDLNFASWMTFNIPGMLICTFVGWVWLQYQFLGLRRKDAEKKVANEDTTALKRILSSKYKALGPVSFHEAIVMGLFAFLFVLWVFRRPGDSVGWAKFFSNIYGDAIEITDATSVILIVFLLFIIPSNLPLIMDSKSPVVPTCTGCLNWQHLQNKIPWGVVLLIGSGFAIAEGASRSQLSSWIGQQFSDLQGVPIPFLLLLTTMFAILVTNVASNNVTAAILLPVLNELSLVLCSNPLYFMLPVTVCCSYAFMFPVATPPNAMVYYAGKISLTEMVRAGLGMNILCFFIINIAINTYGSSLFNFNELPTWVNSTTSEIVLNC